MRASKLQTPVANSTSKLTRFNDQDKLQGDEGNSGNNYLSPITCQA